MSLVAPPRRWAKTGSVRRAMAQQPTPIFPSRESIVQEFAVLDGEVAVFKPKLSRHKDLRDVILSWDPNLPPASTKLLPGLTFDVLVTACDSERRVTVEGKRKLWKLWKAGEFLRRCTVTLKVLPDPKDPLSLYTIKDSCGPRHLKPLPRAA